MSEKNYNGQVYHLWNPYTDTESFLNYLGVGPSIISRGEGPYLFNPRGERYLNVNSCVWNVGLGLGREELVEVAADQMRQLAFSGCWTLAHPKALQFAARLIEITGGHYNKVYLGANGSEAVETALKMARQYHKQSPEMADRGRYKVISLKGSYHGFSYGAVSTSGLDHDQANFGPLLPGFLQIDPPYCYRCPYGQESYPQCGLKCAAALENRIEAQGVETVAAFIMEPIMGDFGVICPPEAYYARVGQICQQYGLLFIVDEVTTGFGRTGKLFTSQDWQVQPDILCLGKTISSGYIPLSATLATQAIYERFLGPDNYFTHGSTHSGHPVSAAVGLAAVEIIVKEELAQNAARIGRYLKSRLDQLMEKHEIIGEVRGQGLMMALELVQDRATKAPLTDAETYELGVDAFIGGMIFSFSRNNFRFFPPLIIKEPFVDEMITILDRSLSTGFKANVSRKARLAKAFARSKLPNLAPERVN